MSPSRTRRPLFEAKHIVDGLKGQGISWPKNVSQQNFFAVICSLWTSNADEFSKPKLDSTGTRIFNEFVDAVDCFQNSKYQDFMENKEHEIEIMLIQYNRGNGKVMHSRIFFP